MSGSRGGYSAIGGPRSQRLERLDQRPSRTSNDRNSGPAAGVVKSERLKIEAFGSVAYADFARFNVWSAGEPPARSRCTFEGGVRDLRTERAERPMVSDAAPST